MQSVQEYARHAEISPRAVRSRISRGDLPAQKVGGIWVISDDGRPHGRRGQGRRLSCRSFDMLADSLDGKVESLTPDERRRARERARRIVDGGVEQVKEFGRRPDLTVRTFRASQDDLGEMLADRRLVGTGVMHPDAEVYGPVVDAYVTPADAEEIELFHLLAPSVGSEANIRLRIQDPPPQVRRLHVIADLLDDHSVRSWREARRLLSQVIGETS